MLSFIIKFRGFKMGKQQAISTFFKPATSNKRQSTESDEEQPVKKQKTSENKTNDVLSPQQNNRIEENKMAAKIKLLAKKMPALSNIGISWFKALESQFSMEYFQKLSDFVRQERQKYTVYPPDDKVFTWTRMCEIKQVKVVILGQDPYHGPNQAHGLAFSVQMGVTPPPSLVNMFKELSTDIPDFVTPNHGDLTGWSKQGVLLLNSCLTVRAHNANSHKDQGWEKLTDAVIKWLNENLKNVVFLLWGSYAQKKGSFIDKKKHLVLQCPHPSPFSANKGFFGCCHFSKTNDYLEKHGKKPIDWSNLST
ncbi:uracil-DNA glycosylase 2-like isoform X1 [Centruroides vittatus]|uniref:uracil-DNA glycosylase 2-like isoform X1 n=1 Tax=Centruroides vittatus TaxID=120091 RepID=UPI00350EEDA8